MSVESDLKKAARLVREADERLAERKRQRAEAVRAAIKSGLSVRETAEIAGLSPQQVQNIKTGDPTGSRYGKARRLTLSEITLPAPAPAETPSEKIEAPAPPAEPKADTQKPARKRQTRKPAAKKATPKTQPKAETNGSKKVGPAEVAEMIETLVSKGSSVKDASEKVGEKLGRSANSLAQTYYRVKRQGTGPAKVKPSRGKAKTRKGTSLADALTETASALRALAAEVRAVEKTAAKGSEAESQLAEVKAKLKALR